MSDWRKSDDMDEYAAKWREERSDGPPPKLISTRRWTAHYGGVPQLRLPDGWTPLSITSATPRGLIDFEDNTKITAVGGTISQITDSISTSNFVQATGAAQPALITSGASGRQVASFDGTDDILAIEAGIPTNWPVAATAGGMFLVCNQTDNLTATRCAVSYGGTATSTNRSIFKQGPPPFDARGNADGASSTNESSNFYGRRSINFIVAPILNCEIDGSAGPLTAATLNTGTTRSRIGANTANTAGNFWLGEISAWVVWEGTLNYEETQYLYMWGRTRLGRI